MQLYKYTEVLTQQLLCKAALQLTWMWAVVLDWLPGKEAVVFRGVTYVLERLAVQIST